MDLVVHWTDFSKNKLKDIFDFHKEKATLKSAKQVIKKADTLINFPE